MIIYKDIERNIAYGKMVTMGCRNSNDVLMS